jgi:uroporphyrinogen III methyltransferase / synthase
MGDQPTVFIIGAGPGDPGLITIRGVQCMSKADVVLYDHLVSTKLLRYARSDSERIDVGPVAPRPMEQQAICFLIAEKAREGKTIARLKWGDPFVFDNGGEEALFLHEQGIRFEVVPGVPAAIGTPAYAGVPVTYPGGGDTVTLVRGYEDGSRTPPGIDWAGLARLEGTIVCYTGPHQAASIAAALIEHGRPADEPAVLVFGGTLPSQVTAAGTLEELASAAKLEDCHDPGILVIGRVTALRDHLRWFDARPLFGKRIVVTRPREQAGRLTEMLEELGATALEAPTIRIVPPEDYGPLDEACRQLDTFDWVVFTSANGVDHFMRRLQAGPGDVRDLKGVRICAIGPGTAEHVTRYGIKVDLMPSEYRAEAVFEALRQADDLSGKRILLPRANIAREWLAEELRRVGAAVTEVWAYRTVPVEGERAGEPDIYKMLLERQIDAVTFTSASTVRSFAGLLGADQAADLLRGTAVASIGPVTAEAAEQLGIATAIMPGEYTIDALVGAIVDHFTEQAANTGAARSRANP